jgi:hypothetical protein
MHQGSSKVALRFALGSIKDLFCRLASVRLARPPLCQSIIGLLGIHPGFSASALDLLPERRAGLEIVHEELRGREGVLAMGRRGDDKDYFVPWAQTTEAMNHAHTSQRPSLFGFLHMAGHLSLRHFWVVLERHGKKRRASLLSPANPGEGDDRADIGAPARKPGHLARCIERLALQTNGRAHGVFD